MATISIGKAWEEAVAFVAREATLLLPVALLFVALPGLILGEMTPPELAAWFAAPDPKVIPTMPPGFALAMFITVVLIWFGSLTLFALALRPGISVGEALRLSVRRLPILLGTALVVLVGIMAVATAAIIVMLIVSAASPTAAAGLSLMLGFAAAILVFFASVRLILLNPVVIDGTLGVIASLRHGWALTRGHFWRLLAFLVVITLLSTIVGAAAQTILGLLAGVIAGPDAARLVGGIAGAAVSSVIQVYMLVMIARLYRQASAA